MSNEDVKILPRRQSDEPLPSLFQRRQSPGAYEDPDYQPRIPQRGGDVSEEEEYSSPTTTPDLPEKKLGLAPPTRPQDRPGNVMSRQDDDSLSTFDRLWNEDEVKTPKIDEDDTDKRGSLTFPSQHDRDYFFPGSKRTINSEETPFAEETSTIQDGELEAGVVNAPRSTQDTRTSGLIAVAEPLSEESDSPASSKAVNAFWVDRRAKLLLVIIVLLLIALIVGLAVAFTRDDQVVQDREAPFEEAFLPGTWEQLGENIAGGDTLELYGGVVALSKDGLTVIGGADDLSRPDRFIVGGAYVHRFVQDTWVQLGQTLVGDVAYDSFGIAVSINANGTIVAVGGYFADPPGVECCNAGHAKVFQLVNDTTWVQMGQDLIGEAKSDRFGLDISLSDEGTRIAVGARQSGRFAKDGGTVRVFDFVNDTWTMVGQHIDGQAEGDRAGEALSLSGDGTRVAIGARGNFNKTGHVRVFDLSPVTGNWTQVGQTIQGSAEGDESGFAVSLSSAGMRVAIGAPKHNGIRGNLTGQVRAFELSSTGTWQILGEPIEGATAGDEFGRALALNEDGTTLAVGAPFSAAEAVDAGQTRIFRFVDSMWIRIGATVNGESRDDESGGAVALSADGRILAVGAQEANEGLGNSGQVRIFELVE